MKRMALAFPLFFFLLILPIAYAQVTSVVHFEDIVPQLVLTDFNVTPTTMNQGQTADFSLTLQNTGLASATANGSVYIYDAGNNLVSSFGYDSVVIGPGGTTIEVKTWSSGTLGAGIYTAYANATYGSNYTNTLNVSFVIRTTPPTPGPGPGGGGGGGGAGAGKPKPQPVPISIIPIGEDVRFGRVPALKEVLAGEGDLESFTLINTGPENVSMDLSLDGVPQEWMRLQYNRSVVLSKESSIVNLIIDVPSDALSGNYLVKIEADGYGYHATDYMLLRVKNYAKWHQYPVYLKTIRTDLLEGKTDVSIRLKNPSDNNIKSMTVKETIPPSIRTDLMSIDFKNKIGSISNIGGTQVITWNVSDLGPLEEMTISYSLNKVLTNYYEYGVWYLRQMDVGGRVDTASLVRVVDLSSQTISPGGSGDVTATILYAGSEPLEVTAALELPPGFRSDPGYTQVLLIPRGLSNVNFRITAPKDVQQTHLIRAVLMNKDFNVFSSAPIVVRRGESSIIGGQTPIIIGNQGAVQTATIQLPWLDIFVGMLAVAFAFGVLAVVFVSARSAFSGTGHVVQRQTYDFERVKDMSRIRSVINRSVRDILK